VPNDLNSSLELRDQIKDFENVSLWFSDEPNPDIVKICKERADEIHILFFNNLSEALPRMIRAVKELQPLAIQNKKFRLYFYVFDKPPNFVLHLLPEFAQISVISYPFYTQEFSVTLDDSFKISFAAELKESYTKDIHRIIHAFEVNAKLNIPKLNSSIRLCQEDYVKTLSLLDKVKCSTSEEALSIVKSVDDLSLIFSDLYRLRLAIYLKNLSRHFETIFVGSHFSGFGIDSYQTNRLHSKGISGTFSLDPGSHTLSNVFYYRIVDLFTKGSIPIPIGYSYSHVSLSVGSLFIPDLTSKSILDMSRQLSALKGTTIEVSVCPPDAPNIVKTNFI
jgi:hypothetical protein